MDIEAYRRRWAAWLPGGLADLAADDFVKAFAELPVPTADEVSPPPAAVAPPAGALDVAIVTSSGAFDRRTQAPFAATAIVGDIAMRTFPIATPDEAIAFAHEHFDHSFAQADPECVLPRRSLAATGVAVAETLVSYGGYLVDWPAFLESTVPQIVAAVRAQGANAALLVPV